MPRLNVRGVDLYFDARGHGDPLVLLHNGLGCTKSFNPQLREFSKHYRVIAYDRYGYGQSTRMFRLARGWLDDSVDELSCFLDQLDIVKAHLCGVCVGGAIALLFAARNPSRVSNVAVAGTCCYGGEEMKAKVLQLYPRPGGLSSDWLKELIRCHGQEYARELYRVFYQAIEAENGYPFKDYDLRSALASVKSPVIVIYGDRDQVFDLEQALAMHRHLEKPELCIIPDCGHLPNEEKPQDFNREVLNFIRRHQDRVSSRRQTYVQPRLTREDAHRRHHR